MSNKSIDTKLLKKYNFPSTENKSEFLKTAIVRDWFDRIRHQARLFRISPITFLRIKKATKIYCNKAFPLKCPAEGEFIGYKKAWDRDPHSNFVRSAVIITLRIPENARRTSGYFSGDGKCRCDKAFVEKIQKLSRKGNLGENIAEAISDYDCNFCYRVGEWVKVRNYDGDRFFECSRGIHFFMSENEAKCYYL